MGRKILTHGRPIELFLAAVSAPQLVNKNGRASAHGAVGHKIVTCDRLIELFLILASAPQLVNKYRGMGYPVCGMMHIKIPLLLIKKSSPYGGSSRFPLSRSEWSFTICLPYNHK